MKLWIVKTLKVWCHMIFTPSPCHKLSHFLRPPPPLEHDILYGRPLRFVLYANMSNKFEHSSFELWQNQNQSEQGYNKT